jgi:hypothetical protein|tara:strand:- start:252 stop:1706 length:1455 start_codon:yes stop_codon:yes gene_type:complete
MGHGLDAQNRKNEIEVQFSYDMPDAYLYQTTAEGKVGQWTYKGPEKLWVFMRKKDNKRSGEVRYSYEVEDNFVPSAHEYMVLVDCKENPLLCELMEVHQDTLFLEGRENITTILPMNDINGVPFKHIEPKVPTPDHTYDRDEIVYDPIAKQWPDKFPFLKPHVNWEQMKQTRWSQLSWSDSHIADDMPTDLADKWKAFRQALRDMPEIYGACWSVAIAAGGTGYSVGDHMNVDASVLGYTTDQIGSLDDLSQPMGRRPGFDFEADPNDGEQWKPTAPADANDSLDVNIIVTSIGQDGAITGVRTRNAFNARHMKEAKTINNVAYTIVMSADSSTTGSGAQFNLSKVERIDPWKIRQPQSPKALQPGIWGENDQFPGATGRYGAVVNGMDASTTLGDNVPDNTDANNRDNPADGWLMEHTYHPATCHFVPPEMDGHYFGTDLARLGLSTDGTPFDDGVADGLPAAPTDAKGRTRIAGTITARKQS